jgi:hypothetical protein
MPCILLLICHVSSYALQAESHELHARRLAMQNKINSGDVPPDIESIREVTDHISSLEAAKSVMIKKLESSGVRVCLSVCLSVSVCVCLSVSVCVCYDQEIGELRCVCMCSGVVARQLNASIEAQYQRRVRAMNDLAEVFILLLICHACILLLICHARSTKGASEP